MKKMAWKQYDKTDINDVGIQRIHACLRFKNPKKRSACLWRLIYDTEIFIDETRKHLPEETAIEPIASKIVERCVDISRETAKWMMQNRPEAIITFGKGYIMEKKEKLNRDINNLQHDINVFQTRKNIGQIKYI